MSDPLPARQRARLAWAPLCVTGVSLLCVGTAFGLTISGQIGLASGSCLLVGTITGVATIPLGVAAIARTPKEDLPSQRRIRAGLIAGGVWTVLLVGFWCWVSTWIGYVAST